MRKMLTLFSIALVSFTLALSAGDANAAKFGGSKSFGKSYRTAPKQQAQPVNNNKPVANQPAAAGAKKGMMGGLLGGLLAGGLLAWMFGSGAFDGLQMMDMIILAGVAFIIFKLVRGMMQAKAGAMARQSSPAPAYSAPYSQPAASAAPAPQEAQGFTAASASPASSGSGFADVPFNLPPGFELQQFLNGARDHYRNLQQAWNVNDLAKIQEYVSPELYNALAEERRSLAGEQHTEVMFVDAELVRADHGTDWAQVSVKFSGRYRDSVEAVEEPINEVWHLERDLRQNNAPWYVVGIEQ